MVLLLARLVVTGLLALVVIGLPVAPQNGRKLQAAEAGTICDNSETGKSLCDGSFTGSDVNLSGLGLTGTIPPQLGDIAGLKYLDLDHNAISPSTPSPVTVGSTLRCGAPATFKFRSEVENAPAGDLGSQEGVTFPDFVADGDKILDLNIQAVDGDDYVTYSGWCPSGGCLAGEFASINLAKEKSTKFRLTFSSPLTLPLELCVFDIDASLKKNSGALKFKESVTACGHTEHFTIEDLTDRVMADKLEIAEDGDCTTFTAEHDSDEEPFRSGDFNPQSPDDIFGAPLSLDLMTAVQRQHQVPRFICLQYAAGTSSVELTLANGGKDNEKGGRNFLLGGAPRQPCGGCAKCVSDFAAVGGCEAWITGYDTGGLTADLMDWSGCEDCEASQWEGCSSVACGEARKFHNECDGDAACFQAKVCADSRVCASWKSANCGGARQLFAAGEVTKMRGAEISRVELGSPLVRHCL